MSSRNLSKFLICALIPVAFVACSVDSAKSRYLLAEKLWNDGKYVASVGEFEKVIVKDPNGRLGLQARYRAAMTETLYLSRHDEAIQKLRAYVEQGGGTPQTWDAQKQIGEIYFSKTEQYEKAILYYRNLLKEHPKVAEAPEFLYRIGRSHFFLWQFDEAISSYQELIKNFPKTLSAEQAAYEIGVTHFTRGAQPSAGRVAGLETYQEAMDAFQKFIERHPQSKLVPEAKFGIASCLEELDQLDAAYHQYEALLSSYPSPRVIQIKMIRIQERKTQRNR